MDRPLVSILIPCHNAENWIAEAIESGIAQTWPAKEIIVLDDGSTDRSLDIIRGFGERIRSEAAKHRGGNATRNRLLELARGEWIQYLDADDYLRPTKIERQIEYALTHPHYDVICSPTAWEHLENGRLVCADEHIPEPRDPWLLLALWRLPQTGGALWRRSTLEKVGAWRVEQTCCQEHELYCRLLEESYKFGFCDHCLAVYRDLDHDGRVTRRSRNEIDLQRLAICDRIEKWLREHGELTMSRRQAVNNARHEVSRMLWLRDRDLASSVLRKIQASDPTFRPSSGPASPQLYRLVYSVFGFHWTQIISAVKRLLVSDGRR
jgi:glycosyltransferase involved in cell wall biosynthesis